MLLRSKEINVIPASLLDWSFGKLTILFWPLCLPVIANQEKLVEWRNQWMNVKNTQISETGSVAKEAHSVDMS